MNFFNIGPGEFLLLLIMALLVFGPQRLPEVARKAGQAVRDLRNMVNNLDPELLEDWRDITRDLETVREEMQHIRSDVVDLQRDLAGAAKEVAASVDEAVKEASATVDEGVKAVQTAGTRRAAATGAQAQPATANASGASTSAGSGSAASALKPASGPAKAAVAAGSAPAPSHGAATKGARAVTSAQGPAREELAEEIIGTLLIRGEDGNWRSLNEVVGVKVFPAWRQAPRAVHSGNGHRLDLVVASREARMVHLAAPRPAGPRAYPAVGAARLNPRPRPAVAARLGRVKRG